MQQLLRTPPVRGVHGEPAEISFAHSRRARERQRSVRVVLKPGAVGLPARPLAPAQPYARLRVEVAERLAQRVDLVERCSASSNS